jgi:hypothetical protein
MNNTAYNETPYERRKIMNNTKLKKLGKNIKYYGPAVLTVSYVVITVAIAVHYNSKVLLEMTPKAMDYMRSTGGGVLYVLPSGDNALLMLIPTQ